MGLQFTIPRILHLLSEPTLHYNEMVVEHNSVIQANTEIVAV